MIPVESVKVVAIGIFVCVYILLLALPKYRAHVSIAGACLFVILGILPWQQALALVEWNVIMMIAGTMGIVALFIESKMPALMGDAILRRVPNVKWAIISLALFAGIISAFVDNVATVLMIAPIALVVAKRLDIPPVQMIVAIAVSSNLQGAATLVGDTTAILLGAAANMNFVDFFFFQGKASMFWVVQVGAIASALVMLVLFKKYNQPIIEMEKPEVSDYFPTVLLVGMIILLIVTSIIPADKKPINTNGYICMALMLLGVVHAILVRKDKDLAKLAIKEVDYFTLFLLAGLFVIIGGISETGVISDISALFVRLTGDNIFIIYTLIVWFSVIASAFIDNIPYVATMLPVVAGISSIMGIPPYLLYFGLLTGATLGGNLTPIGASANIAGIGILRKEGHEVSAKEFMKISVPFTLSAVITGYIMIWMIWR
jgi:Na+/H+ antiporter NhaD and related arsenite permeases